MVFIDHIENVISMHNATFKYFQFVEEVLKRQFKIMQRTNLGTTSLAAVFNFVISKNKALQ